MKLNQNILLGTIAVILCILLAYYWFFMNKVKEGLTAMTTINLTSPETIPMKITSLVISEGSDYLQLSELLIKDRNGAVIPYSTTNAASATNKGYVSTSKGPYNSANGLDKLYDTDPYSIYHSSSGNDVLTIYFFDPVDIGSVLIRNRQDCCQTRLNRYILKLYSNNLVIISRSLTDSALYSGTVSVNWNDQASKDNFMNSNVITYNIIQPPNVTGAPGSVGPTGPAGFTGPAGIAGSTGSAGPAGSTGPAGPVGPAGVRGTEGPIGPTGPAGMDGINGIDGINSINGSNGQGPQGISRANEYSYFGASSIQTIENFSIMESLSEPMACLSSPASYM